MYKYLIFIFFTVTSTVSLANDSYIPETFELNNKNPFIIDENTTFLMEKCDFSDSLDSPYYLEKMPTLNDLNNFISIIDKKMEKAKIEFSDSSNMFNGKSISIVSNGKIYYKDSNSNRVVENKRYNGLCKGIVSEHIKRVNSETLKCFNGDNDYISKNKLTKQVKINKHRSFKVSINGDNNGQAYLILDDEVYIPGIQIKENNDYKYFKLCKKPINIRY